MSNFDENMMNNAWLASSYNKRYEEVKADCKRIFNNFKMNQVIEDRRICCDKEFLVRRNFLYQWKFDEWNKEYSFGQGCADKNGNECFNLCHSYCKDLLE